MSEPRSVVEVRASIQRGQRWQRKKTVGPANSLRVLAVAEGHAMVRYPYCQVWAIDEKKLRNEYELLTDDERSQS